MQLQEIISEIQSYHPNPDLELIRKAHAFALEHHKGQTRSSGEPYITHVMEVAFLAAKLRLDSFSIAAALLHDTIEDTSATLEMIQKEFGTEVSEIVDGVTKLSQVNFSSKAEAQSENFRKMLLAIAKDIRVLMLKLSDRTHNMRSLEFLSEARQNRIAQETIDIYAPLAHRLGINWMKSELEDLSLRFLKPTVYNSIKEHIKTNKKERMRYIDEVVDIVTTELKKNSINAEVTGRPKHFYSIYQKMDKDGLNFDEIFDLLAFRILVTSTMECYAALGLIHAAWKPIPGRFKDFVAMPKSNNYQSLHSTVIGPKGQRIEFQIRTYEMHEIAERGIAAHWKYKASPDGKVESYEFPWLKDLIESEKLLSDPFEFLSSVKEDLYSAEVFVFSPKGDLIALPLGSTPIDFAYQIHTQVGNHCSGARINGRQVTLNYKLQNGDTIEIVTQESQSPSKDWLQTVVTTKAKQRIRAWLRTEERERSIGLGKEILEKALRKVKLSYAKALKDNSLENAIIALGYKELDSALADISYGKLSQKNILSKLLPESTDLDEQLEREESTLHRIFQRAAQAFRDKTGIKVHGLDDVIFRFAKCCEPLPGDDLVGFITRGRGVTIHARTCQQALNVEPQRLIEVTWDTTIKTVRPIRLEVLCQDRVGMLAALTQCISNAGANILNASVKQDSNNHSMCGFEINVENASQLRDLRRKLEQLTGVIRVERARRA